MATHLRLMRERRYVIAPDRTLQGCGGMRVWRE
jgi:hypothetical protein